MKFKSKNNNQFFSDLKTRVDDYLLSKGGDRFADKSIYVKAVVLIVGYLSCYFTLLSGLLSDALSVLVAMLMGVIAVMIVFNIVHDASHNVFFKNAKYNRLAAYLGDLVGMNSYIWNIRHNIQHHTFTNVAGGDILLDNIPLVRISPHQKKYRIHQYQVFYVPLLYMLYSIFWVFFLDLNCLLQKNMGNLKNIRHPASEWFKFFVFKLVYVIYMLIIPIFIAQISASTVLFGFLLYHIAAGILLSSVVVPGHCVEGAEYVSPDDDGLIDNSWMQHEWNTTYDCSTGSKLLHWISGGLNTHLAHHLFPKFSHCHYYTITKIIKEHCVRYNTRYPHFSFAKAIVSHFRFLNIQGNTPGPASSSNNKPKFKNKIYDTL